MVGEGEKGRGRRGGRGKGRGGRGKWRGGEGFGSWAEAGRGSGPGKGGIVKRDGAMAGGWERWSHEGEMGEEMVP